MARAGARSSSASPLVRPRGRRRLARPRDGPASDLSACEVDEHVDGVGVEGIHVRHERLVATKLGTVGRDEHGELEVVGLAHRRHREGAHRAGGADHPHATHRRDPTNAERGGRWRCTPPPRRDDRDEREERGGRHGAREEARDEVRRVVERDERGAAGTATDWTSPRGWTATSLPAPPARGATDARHPGSQASDHTSVLATRARTSTRVVPVSAEESTRVVPPAPTSPYVAGRTDGALNTLSGPVTPTSCHSPASRPACAAGVSGAGVPPTRRARSSSRRRAGARS